MILKSEVYGIDVFGHSRTEPYYDGTGRGKREVPSYIRFGPDLARRKISLLCQFIHQHNAEGLEDYEAEATLKLLEKGVRGDPPVLSPQVAPKNRSCTPQNGLERPSKARSSVDFEGAGWKSSDTAILNLASRWLLATDFELQWILYHRRGKQWKAHCFPTTRETLLRYLRELGIEADLKTIEIIANWPATFQGWLKQEKE